MKLALRVLLLFVIWGGADRHEYEGKLSKAMREYD